MEPDEIEAWVKAVVAALRPALLVHVRAWEHLDIVAPPPDELAETLAQHARTLMEQADD